MREYHFDEDEPYVVIEKSEGSTGSFLLGLALGAGLALLFAPRSGEETRRELNRGARRVRDAAQGMRSEEHTSELQSPCNLVCRILLEKNKKNELEFVEYIVH